MPVSIAIVKELEGVDPKTRRIFIKILEEVDRQIGEIVTKKEFNGHLSRKLCLI